MGSMSTNRNSEERGYGSGKGHNAMVDSGSFLPELSPLMMT